MFEKAVHAILNSPIVAVCAVLNLVLGIRDVLGKDRLWLTGKYDDPEYRAAWQRRDGIAELTMAALFGSYLLPSKYEKLKLVVDIICLVALVAHLALYLVWQHSDSSED